MEISCSLAFQLIITSIVILVFLLIPFVQIKVAKQLPEEMQALYKKLAKDAFIKTLLMFAGAAFFGALAFFKGGIEKAITQSLFALCLFTAASSSWLIIKTNESIKEAREASIKGKRKGKILEIERINIEMAKKTTIISFLAGLLGCLYMAFLYDSYPLSWAWFVGLISTGPAMLSARWSDAANTAISKYASDPKFDE